VKTLLGRGTFAVAVVVQALLRTVPSQAEPNEPLFAGAASETISVEPGSLRTPADLTLARTVQRLNAGWAQSESDRLARPIVRGMGATESLVLDRGLPVFDFQLADLDGPVVDPRGSRVALVRGPWSAVHGTDASGGVIEITPQKLSPSAEDSGIHSRAELYGASGDRGAAGSRSSVVRTANTAGERRAERDAPID
jgi:hypothetical protein